MAYFYTSNYSPNFDNYDQCYYNNHEPRYVNEYSNTELHENAYQHALTPSLVGYYYDQPEFLASKNANFEENGEYCYYYYDPVSTEFVVSYNSTTAEGADVVEEKAPKTLSLGDVGSVPSHGLKEGLVSAADPKKPGGSSEVIHEENPSDFEDDEEFDDDYDDDYDEEEEEYDEEELEEKKQDDVDKEPSKLGPIVPLVGALPTKEGQGLDGEAKIKDGGAGGEVIEGKKALDLEVNDEGKGKGKGEGESNLDEPKPKNETIGEVIQGKKALDLEVNDEGEGEGDLGESKPKNETIGEVIQGKKDLDLEVNDEGKGKGEGEGEGKLGEPKPKSESIGEVIQEEKASEQVQEDEDEDDFEEGEDEDDFEEGEDEDEGEGEGEGEGESEGKGGLGNEGAKQEDYGNQVRRQIPPGYGMEAFDICEGLFGGYFPCLWKRNQRIYNHQREVNETISDYDYCWKETADYLFGNPNPYGGTMPEKGSYGDPIYSYQRHYPQQTITGKIENHGGNSSYLQNSRYVYGHNGGY